MSDSEEENITLEVDDVNDTSAEEEAARKAAEEEAARKAAEEEAARKAAEEEAARKAAEEAEKKEMEEQLEEINRLREINNERWKEGLSDGFDSLTHTTKGVVKFELINRGRTHTSYMTTLLTKGTSGFAAPKPKKQEAIDPAKTRGTINHRGMMFDRFRF